MSYSENKVLCGACKCAVKTVTNPKPHDQVVCPRCGRSDRFDKVMATIGEQYQHVLHQKLAKSLAASTRGNSMIKFKPQNVPSRQFRWMMEKGV